MGLFFAYLFIGSLIHGTENHSLPADYASVVASRRQDCIQQDFFLYTCGNKRQISRIVKLLSAVQKYPQGHKALSAISFSGHTLMIGHSSSALATAGRTSAPLTSSLSNGTGSSAVILMDFDIPDEGSHRVGGTLEEWAMFTAEQNFYHELAHAHHKMTGIFMGHRGEQQAIEDENIYRLQQNPFERNLRSLNIEKGEQIWFGQAR